jgi:hypothetical protein
MTESLGAILLSPRLVATGDPAGAALENINTEFLGDGALCYVSTGALGQWQLQKDSVAVPDGVTIVEPIAGPGRWFLKTGGGGGGAVDSVSGINGISVAPATGNVVASGSALYARDASNGPMLANVDMDDNNILLVPSVTNTAGALVLSAAADVLISSTGADVEMLTLSGQISGIAGAPSGIFFNATDAAATAILSATGSGGTARLVASGASATAEVLGGAVDVASGLGRDAQLRSGTSNNATATGAVTVATGDNTDTGDAGVLTLKGGFAGGGNGSQLVLQGATAGAGGGIQMIAGAGAVPGSVFIQAGGGPGGGVTLEGAGAPASVQGSDVVLASSGGDLTLQAGGASPDAWPTTNGVAGQVLSIASEGAPNVLSWITLPTVPTVGVTVVAAAAAGTVAAPAANSMQTYVLTNAGARTISLPATAPNGARIVVKDGNGAGTNIAVSVAGGGTIDFSTTYNIATIGGAGTFQWDSTSGQWWVI